MKIYRDNINGIIFTLIFHILFLAFAMTQKFEVRYEVDSNDIVLVESVPEPIEKPKENPKAKYLSKPEVKSSAAVNDSHLSESTTDDPFFDQSYQDEIAEAEKLMNRVNKQLQKNNVPSESIASKSVPKKKVDNASKRDRKKTVFVGKSNIHYSLEGRFHTHLPIPIYLAENGGKVFVDIIVNRRGSVISANLNNAKSSYDDPSLVKYALEAAKSSTFDPSTTSSNRQSGYIVYTFVPQ
ncbi:hypothetical protein K4L44_02320 [Halosquirtibacter laminarini]|uniref:Uncharacterized protein n=1 Tax=Halosquirtibacter laminarini TaxID=3374600 RepID=A0AC61NNF5_9BACT|nr:hypothetical protein K4L44_02320 [Prolixibacteraceae bacterium]